MAKGNRRTKLKLDKPAENAMKNWIIVGATSAIAEATARVWAARGYKLFLVARNSDKLAIVKNDLEVRGAQQVGVFTMDANDIPNHQIMKRTIL